MKPVFTWDTFAQGITEDRTAPNNQGFSLISGLTIKRDLGVMSLTRELWALPQPVTMSNSQASGVYNSPWINKVVNWQMENWNGAGSDANPVPMQVYWTGEGGLGVVVKKLVNGTWGLKWNPYILNPNFAYTSNTYQPNGQPQYAELEVFQNRLVFPFGQDKIQSVWGMNTGKREAVTCTSGSPTITLTEGTWDAKITGSKITFSKDGGTDVYEYTISAYVNTTTATLSANFTQTTGNYKATATRYVDGWLRDDNVVTPLTLSKKSKLYRPMIVFGRQLYIADGNIVAKLSDDGLWAQSIMDIGKDYAIKKFVQVNGSLYILADKIDENFMSVYDDQVLGSSQSIIAQWDGTSKNLNNVIEIGTHCFAVEAFENRLYAILKQRGRQGEGSLTLAYYSGSDFPTLARIPAYSAYPNCFAMERGTIYIWVNGWVSPWVYVYASFSTEQGSVSLEYPVTNEDIKSLWYVAFGGGYYLSSQLLFVNTNTESRAPWLFRENGVIETNWIEVTPNQFWQLVKGIQMSFYQDLPAWAYVGIQYAVDGSTTYETLGDISISNMYEILLGMYVRPRKIKLRFTVHASTNRYYSPEITKIQLY